MPEKAFDVIISKIAPLCGTRDHSLTLIQARTDLVCLRVRLTALIAAILMVAWVPIDFAFMPWEGIRGIIIARVIAASALMAILFYKPRSPTPLNISGLLTLLVAIPLLFFCYANGHLQGMAFEEKTLFVKSSYAQFPVLIAMLLSLFPLTAKEGIVIGGSITAITFLASSLPETPAHTLLDQGTIWIQLVVTGLAIIAGMSQLHFMAGFVEYSTIDAMTGCLKRDYGLKLLETLFAVAQRRQTPCCLLFVDLDHFKRVNDTFGHDKGDDVLKDAAARMRKAVRSQDTIVRWGGEEFLIVLPNTSTKDLNPIFERLKSEGLGILPDGSIQTASIGVAECIEDGLKIPLDLVTLADQRMYEAKKGGRNAVTMKSGSFALVYL